MILSKANLCAVAIASDDKTVPMLNNLHVEADGTTVAANGRCVLAVSPVPDAVRHGLGYMVDSGSVGKITIAADTVKEVLRNMPRDAKFGGLLEYTDLMKSDKGVTFRLRDGMRDRSIDAKVYNRSYFDYRVAFQKAAEASLQGKTMRVVLNRKRLLSLLTAIDKLCPDSSGESPVYLEFTHAEDVVLRAEGNNGQKILGYMKAYEVPEVQWPVVDAWERKMCNEQCSPVQVGKRKPARKGG